MDLIEGRFQSFAVFKGPWRTSVPNFQQHRSMRRSVVNNSAHFPGPFFYRSEIVARFFSRDEGTELQQISQDIGLDQSSTLSDVVLEFTYVALFLNADEAKGLWSKI